jgi:predicted metal-dependent phosphoesterase TrpH
MPRPADARGARRVADLHTHSTCSDGVLAPSALVAAAAARGVQHLALTDHDTLAGVAEASTAAAALGIELIAGVELSVWHAREVHLLGYFVDPSDPALRVATEAQRRARIARVHLVCARLETLGAPIDPAAVLASADGNVGRPHIARALVAAGHARNFDDAFRRFLGADAAAYVPPERLDLAQGVRLIHGAGGVAVIAHPGVEGLAEQIPSMVAVGLDGVETEHPGHCPRTARRFRSIARAHDLVTTGGSDFHSPGAKADLGDLGVDQAQLDALRARAAQNAALAHPGGPS